MGVKEEKAAIRSEIAAIRIRPDDRVIASCAVCDRVLSQEAWCKARTVLSYAALADEICLAALWGAEKQFVFPRFRPDRGYEAAAVAHSNDLVPGKFGILEPPIEAPEIVPDQVELVLVPGVAFDSDGNRLGRGRGFYDRWLKKLRGTKIGVGFDHQLIDAVPIEPHDVPLNAVVVPSRIVD